MTPLEKPVLRLTRGGLDRTYGADNGRRLVAGLEMGDLITIRPHGTRRKETVSIFDVYRWAIIRRVNCQRLELARAKKEKLADTRIRRRLQRGIRA